MAHVAKYNSKSLGNLVAHYERSRQSTLDRSNVDQSRTALNYDLRPSDIHQEIQAALAQHEQTAGRSARSDAVVMFDWVVTLPGNVPEERSREFFESVTSFIEGRYGAGNVLGAFVHLDEATPHVHVAVLPLLDGKLQASKMVNRADLKTFHKALKAAVSADMGFEVEILLPDGKRAEKELSRLPQADYKAAKKEIAATAERLERVRRVEEGTRGTPLSDIRERAAEKRLDEDIARLEREIAIERERIAGIDERIAGLRERIVQLVERIGELRESLLPLREFQRRAAENTRRANQQLMAIHARANSTAAPSPGEDMRAAQQPGRFVEAHVVRPPSR